jgi:formylglycine-generating enzyme required for sulfatase activity
MIFWRLNFMEESMSIAKILTKFVLVLAGIISIYGITFADDCKYWFEKGINSTNTDEKIECFTKAAELNPIGDCGTGQKGVAYFNRGNAYVDKKEYDRAITDYTKAIKINKKFIDAYFSRGLVYEIKELHDEAIKDFTKTIELNPRYEAAYFNRGIACLKKENHNETIDDFTKRYKNMVLVPAGNFKMGQKDVAIPVHTVYLDAYYIDKYEVTNGQYKLFMDSGGYSDSRYWGYYGDSWRSYFAPTQPAYWDDSIFGYNAPNGPNLPVVGVCFYEAWAYAMWAGKRLPTEAEWEKAARGTDQRTYPWGNTWYNNYSNWYDGDGSQDGYRYTVSVGSYESGKSPYGCYDMAGNVWEWCIDLYDVSYYYNSSRKNPRGPSGPKGSDEDHVLRGGSCRNISASCKSARRYYNDVKSRENNNGFRCVLEAP